VFRAAKSGMNLRCSRDHPLVRASAVQLLFGETQAGSVGVRAPVICGFPDGTRRSESTAATAATTVNTVKASVNPSIEGVLVRAAAATVEATATQSSEAVSWAWLDLNPRTSS
jgi:hypothetical protein